MALGTLLIHGFLAWWVPMPGAFRKYAVAAEHLLEGKLPLERLVDFSPLYFQLSLFLERTTSRPEWLLEWIQIVLAAAATGLFATLLARRFSPGIALGTALLLALDRHLLVFERVLEPEALLLFFLLLVLVCLELEHPVAHAVAGVSGALALLTRPTFLPVFLLVPLYYFIQGQKPATALRRSALFLTPIVLALVLLAFRAERITGDAGTPVMNPGTVFFEGNNPLTHGTSAIYPPVVLNFVRHSLGIPDSAHEHYRTVARAATGKPLTISEVNAFWFDRARACLEADPSWALGLWLEKLQRVMHSFRWHDVTTAWKYDQRVPVPSVPFGLLVSLALPGALLAARRWQENLLFYALAGAQVAVMVVFYVSARQRLVLLPAVLYFAAITFQWLGQKRRRLALLPLLAAFGLLLTLPDDAMLDETRQRRGHFETDRYLEEVRQRSRTELLTQHADLVVEALTSSPWWFDWLHPIYFPRSEGSLEERLATRLQSTVGPIPSAADFDLAWMELRAGRDPQAIPRLEALLDYGITAYRGGRQTSRPRVLLARALALRGDRDVARSLLEESLAEVPGDPFTLAERIALDDDPASAAKLQALWSAPDAHFLLGQALIAHGRYPEAAQVLAKVVQKLETFRDARVFLAAALGGAGDLDGGAEQYLRAMEQGQEPVLASALITDLFRRWSKTHPEDLQVQIFAARVLHQHGHFAEALERLEGLDLSLEHRQQVENELHRLRRELGIESAP